MDVGLNCPNRKLALFPRNCDQTGLDWQQVDLTLLKSFVWSMSFCFRWKFANDYRSSEVRTGTTFVSGAWCSWHLSEGWWLGRLLWLRRGAGLLMPMLKRSESGIQKFSCGSTVPQSTKIQLLPQFQGKSKTRQKPAKQRLSRPDLRFASRKNSKTTQKEAGATTQKRRWVDDLENWWHTTWDRRWCLRNWYLSWLGCCTCVWANTFCWWTTYFCNRSTLMLNSPGSNSKILQGGPDIRFRCKKRTPKLASCAFFSCFGVLFVALF